MTSDDERYREGRYRKVKVRTWGDDKFRRLSPIPPCGQGLWFFLMTGPQTGPIPGLFRAGVASMAEELNWSTEAFREAFQEAFREGMVKADFAARVVWLPKAIEHNRPESPNVVKSWGSEFDLIPECELKLEAYESLKSFIYKLGEGFSKAFDMAIRKPIVKASGKPSAKPFGKAIANQEQEQEQEQTPKPLHTHTARARAGDQVESHERFQRLKGNYPPGQARHNWIAAEKACRQHISDGEIDWDTTERNLAAYRELCDATQRIPMAAEKYFTAPDRPYLNTWPMPPKRADAPRKTRFEQGMDRLHGNNGK